MRVCDSTYARVLQDGTIREITLVYPELLFSLVGKEVYRRCDDALGSLDPDVRQQGLQELQTALYNSTAFTTGFACSVSLGWKGGAPGEGKLQGIFVRPADPKHVEVTNPGAGWQIVPKKDHTVYAYQVEEQTWGPTPSNQPAPGKACIAAPCLTEFCRTYDRRCDGPLGVSAQRWLASCRVCGAARVWWCTDLPCRRDFC